MLGISRRLHWSGGWRLNLLSLLWCACPLFSGPQGSPLGRRLVSNLWFPIANADDVGHDTPEQSELQQDRKRIWQLLFRYIVLLVTEHKNDLRIVTQGAYEQKIISISYFLKVEEVGICWFYHILNKKLTSAYNLKIAISNAYSSFRCLSLPNISMHFCKSVVLSTRY